MRHTRYFGSAARYAVVKTAPGIVWIRDLDDGAISITNDAENVVRKLNASHSRARIIYCDTMGKWDELVHDGRGTFIGFAPARDMAP